VQPDEVELWQATLEGKPVISRAPAVKKEAVLTQACPKNPSTPLPVPLLDKAHQTKLKTGKMAIEATLDLHGLNREEAYIALVKFIENLAKRGLRAALVITGKGEKEGGTLRNLFPRWLNEPPLRERIIAYDKAAPRHGGSGAWYVRIRKAKNDRG